MKKLMLVLSLAIYACGGEDPAEEEPMCEAGRVEPCACSDGSIGAQTCAASGDAWGTCRCDSSSANDCSSDDDCSIDLPYCYRGDCSPPAVVGEGRECKPPAIICEGELGCNRNGELGEIGHCEY